MLGSEFTVPGRDDGEDLRACVQYAMEGWEFPAPKRAGVSIVSLRVTLRPGKP